MEASGCMQGDLHKPLQHSYSADTYRYIHINRERAHAAKTYQYIDACVTGYQYETLTSSNIPSYIQYHKAHAHTSRNQRRHGCLCHWMSTNTMSIANCLELNIVDLQYNSQGQRRSQNRILIASAETSEYTNRMESSSGCMAGRSA